MPEVTAGAPHGHRSRAAAARVRRTRPARCGRSRASTAGAARCRFRSCAARRPARSTRRRSPLTPTISGAAWRGSLRWWRRIGGVDVYRADFASLSRHSAQFLAAVLTGARARRRRGLAARQHAARELLREEFDFGRVAARIGEGAPARARHQRHELHHGPRRELLRRRAGHHRVAAHAAGRRAREAVPRALARDHGDSVPVSRRRASTATSTWTARCASSRRFPPR